MLFGLVGPCAGGPTSAPTPVVWSGAPARRMRLESQPFGIDPDGRARWLVRVKFSDADGRPTTLAANGDIEFKASRGEAQWQTRSRFGGPAAIVRTTRDGPLEVRAVSVAPAGIPDSVAQTDTRTWRMPHSVARALGPHLAQVGWFPAAHVAVRVVRSGDDGTKTVCLLAPPSSTCRDARVRPRATYRYSVERSGQRTALSEITIPGEPPPQSLDALRGKGMWLRFSPDTADADGYDKLDPNALVARARSAGLRYIELRMAYGEYWEVTPAAKPFVDAFIDAATRAGIGVIAWTVPRSTSFDDLALATAAANYQTGSGSRMSGLALDMERGDGYMGDGATGAANVAEYTTRIRQALGSSALILATVEDPYLNKMTNRDFPFSAVARSADVLQPMTYWRMFQKGLDETGARTAVRESILSLRREAHKPIAINMGGQTSGIGPCGAPPPAEIAGSLDESRRAGAIGETFYDWYGTLAPQWDAIAGFKW